MLPLHTHPLQLEKVPNSACAAGSSSLAALAVARRQHAGSQIGWLALLPPAFSCETVLQTCGRDGCVATHGLRAAGGSDGQVRARSACCRVCPGGRCQVVKAPGRDSSPAGSGLQSLGSTHHVVVWFLTRIACGRLQLCVTLDSVLQELVELSTGTLPDIAAPIVVQNDRHGHAQLAAGFQVSLLS